MVRAKKRQFRVATLVAATVFCSGVTALAQATQPSAADMAVRHELVEQAQQAADAGDHARAVDLAERAMRIVASTSLRGLLAHEQAAAGSLADALGNAEMCAREAQSDASMHNRREILRECQGLVTDLRARVGHVAVRVPSPAPDGLHVRVGGRELSEAVLGVPYIVTPGTVVVEASASGREAFRAEVRVDRGATVDVTLWQSAPGSSPAATPAATPASAPAGTPATTPAGSSASSPAQPASAPPPQPIRIDRDTASDGPGVLPFAVMGLGVVALGTAGAMAYLENDALSGLTQHCAQTAAGFQCPDTADNRQRLSSADTYMIVGDIALGVGAVALAAGAVWWLVGRGGHEAAPRASLRVAPTPGGIFVGVGGSL